MRGPKMAALGVVAAMALGACTDREVTEPDPEPITEALLLQALVPAEDVEGATQVGADETGQSGTTSTTAPADPANPSGNLDCVIAFERAGSEIRAIDGVTEVRRRYVVGDMQLMNSVVSAPGAGAQVEQLIRDFAEGCSGVVSEGWTVRSGPLDFGALSDDALSIKFEIEPPGAGPISEVDVILMREGDLVDIVLASGPRPSSKERLDEVVRSAIGRLAGLHDAVT